MTYKLKVILLCLILLPGLTILAQSEKQSAEPLTSRLQGIWKGPGKSFGMEAQLQLNWEPVLGKKFWRLSIRNEMRGPNGQPQLFEGHAYYQTIGAASDGKLQAQWFDSRGVTFPIKAQLEGDALVAFWGSPQQEEGKSTYRMVDAGKVEVVDSVKQKDGTWREFGRFTLTRE